MIICLIDWWIWDIITWSRSSRQISSLCFLFQSANAQNRRWYTVFTLTGNLYLSRSSTSRHTPPVLSMIGQAEVLWFQALSALISAGFLINHQVKRFYFLQFPITKRSYVMIDVQIQIILNHHISIVSPKFFLLSLSLQIDSYSLFQFYPKPFDIFIFDKFSVHWIIHQE